MRAYVRGMDGTEGPVADGIHWPDLVFGLVVVSVGMAVLGGLVYVGATTSVTEAEYAAYSQNCDALAGEERLVDRGLGMETVELNGSDVRACRNATFGEYENARLRSMRAARLNAVQWGWIGGVGLLFTVFGGFVIRRQMTESRRR